MATIHELLPQVSEAIGAIGKTRDNTQQGFKFRGIDEFLNAAHPVLARLGVTVAPYVLDRQVYHHPRDKGGFWTQVFLTVRFDFTAPDGSTVSACTSGEGLDLADKASNKALSSALKYALMQTLCIPLKDMADSDSDARDSTDGAGDSRRGRAAAAAPAASPEARQVFVDAVSGAPDDVQTAMRAWCKQHGIVVARATVQQLEQATAHLATLA